MTDHPKSRSWILAAFLLLGGALSWIGLSTDAVHRIYVVPDSQSTGVFTVELFGVAIHEEHVDYDPPAATERRSRERDRAGGFHFATEARKWTVRLTVGFVVAFGLLGWAVAARSRRGRPA